MSGALVHICNLGGPEMRWGAAGRSPRNLGIQLVWYMQRQARDPVSNNMDGKDRYPRSANLLCAMVLSHLH